MKIVPRPDDAFDIETDEDDDVTVWRIPDGSLTLQNSHNERITIPAALVGPFLDALQKLIKAPAA